ncbi:MAG: hypothetical protein Q9207_008315, partial [Kuettlingeria erythrocarpa]
EIVHSCVFQLVYQNLAYHPLQQAAPPPPGVDLGDLIGRGSTATIWRCPHRAGVVIKSPAHEPQDPDQQLKFRTEVKILNILGNHPRITKYLGPLDQALPNKHLLFVEATNGDMQQYLKNQARNTSLNDGLRLKWCRQAAEGLAYCHSKGVLQQDVRTDNMLLDTNLDLSLTDFGGSRSEHENGGGLPDIGYYDPRDNTWEVTEATEVFGLGSCLYEIMGGYFPHDPASRTTHEKAVVFMEEFERRALEGLFPDTSRMIGGDVINGCWTKEIGSAKEAYTRLAEIEMHSGNTRLAAFGGCI